MHFCRLTRTQLHVLCHNVRSDPELADRDVSPKWVPDVTWRDVTRRDGTGRGGTGRPLPPPRHSTSKRLKKKARNRQNSNIYPGTKAGRSWWRVQIFGLSYVESAPAKYWVAFRLLCRIDLHRRVGFNRVCQRKIMDCYLQWRKKPEHSVAVPSTTQIAEETFVR